MLRDKVVIITGAGSGLGRELSILLAQKDAIVILVGRREKKLEETAKLIEEVGGISDLFSLDISISAEVKDFFNSIKQKYSRVDILINNAGVGSFANLEDLEIKDIDRMIDSNLKGTIYFTREVLYIMKEKNSGQIINIISTAGMRGKAQESVYAASKFGVSGLTKSLQQELKQTRVKVTGVFVGGMQTEFWDQSKQETSSFMLASDVAEVVGELIRKADNMQVSEIVIDRK